MSVDSAENLANSAAIDLVSYHNIGRGNGQPINQALYEMTFAQLPEIAATPKDTLVQAFANAINEGMQNQLSAGNMTPDRTGAFLVLASAAGLDGVAAAAFSKVAVLWPFLFKSAQQYLPSKTSNKTQQTSASSGSFCHGSGF